MRHGFETGSASAGGFSDSRMGGGQEASGRQSHSAFCGQCDSVDALRQKLDELKRVKKELVDRCQQRIQVLEDQMNALRQEESSSAGSRKASEENNEGLPSVRLLAAPLVVRSERGEFLGVQGGRGHFALRDFIDLMHRGTDGGKSIRLDWQRNRENWVLLVTASDEYTGTVRRVVLVVRRFTTPAGNTVALIVRFTIDGHDAGTEALLDMFRKIRAGYGASQRRK